MGGAWAQEQVPLGGSRSSCVTANTCLQVLAGQGSAVLTTSHGGDLQRWISGGSLLCGSGNVS